jgi:hypothetical protein
MTLEEASAVAGPPSASSSDSVGTYYSFGPRAFGVKLAHLQYEDSGPVDTWVVTAAPEDNSVAAVVSPELVVLLSRAGGIAEVTVHEQKRPRLQAFNARVRDGRLFSLQWYSIDGIPGG